MTDPDPTPRDLDAEAQVLGAVLTDGRLLDDLAGRLGVEDFHHPPHAALWSTLLASHAEGGPTDPIAVSARLRAAGDLTRVGGLPALAALVGGLVAASSAGFHAATLEQMTARRRLAAAGTRAVEQAHRPESDVDAATARLRADLDGATASRDGQWTTAEQMFDPILESMVTPPVHGRVLPTGYHDLDHLLNGGLRAGQMVVVAARPGAGKSTAASDWARHVCGHGGKVAFFSLEMGHREVWERIAAAEASVDVNSIRGGDSTDAEVARFTSRATSWEEMGLHVCDTARMTIAQIAAQSRRVRSQAGRLDLIVIDYLQLVDVPRDERRHSRSNDVDAVSRAVKVLAKDLDCPVVVVAQLNRQSEQRADKRPQVSDLRESGQVEQDADVIVLLFAERMDDGQTTGSVDVIVGKNRGGMTGSITMTLQGHYGRLVSPSGWA